jgi:ankyrin repeat protein
MLAGMPKNKKKSKVHDATAAIGGADDEFDKMLAEVAAADPELAADVRASTATTVATSSSSSSSSGSGEQGASSPEMQVSEIAIFGACKRGDISQLRRWGRQGVRVKNADLLVNAIFAEVSSDILRCLVKELGADVNGARLTTPLCAAVLIGNLALVQCLVKELGAEVNQAGSNGATPLYAAAQIGNVGSVQFLVKELGADINKAMQKGFTPLYIAAENGHLAVVRLLVAEFGADVNQAANDGATPLCIAAQNGHLPVMRLLVEELGADVNKAVHDGTTPLSFAAQQGDLSVVRCLAKELGADINQGSHDGITPLHIAVQKGYLAIVRCLVKECSADVNKAMHNGVTPLMIAARFQHEDVSTFLIKYGANVQDSLHSFGTAADLSRKYAAGGRQTEYLEARTHCANTGCDGAGVKKCAGCLKVYYCARECQLAHWLAHKAECRQRADKMASKKT